ncbi:MAG: SHOCT domain-containing protein [Planctomycetota bacterium]
MAVVAKTSILLPALWLASAIAVGAAVIWFVTRLRGGAAEDTREAHNSLAKFRELHARGGLSDDEYRTIKTQLAAKLDQELGDPPAGEGP